MMVVDNMVALLTPISNQNTELTALTRDVPLLGHARCIVPRPTTYNTPAWEAIS